LKNLDYLNIERSDTSLSSISIKEINPTEKEKLREISLYMKEAQKRPSFLLLTDRSEQEEKKRLVR
jgi:hypothetical protein